MPSLAWAVVRDEDTAAGGFGGAGQETVFQIGSVTKVFTALVLADMAERGEVHLSDPAARYLPGPPSDGPTLADLATHTSGLPRLPRGLLPSALLHPGDPYARYPAGRLVRDARRLQPVPGQRLDWRTTRRQGTIRVPWAGSSAMAASSSSAATRPTSSRHMSTLLSGGWAPSAIGSQLS